MSDFWLNPNAKAMNAKDAKNFFNDKPLGFATKSICPVCKKVRTHKDGVAVWLGNKVYAVHSIKAAHRKCGKVWMPEYDYYDAQGVLICSEGDFPSHYDKKGKLVEFWCSGNEDQENW